MRARPPGLMGEDQVEHKTGKQADEVGAVRPIDRAAEVKALTRWTLYAIAAGLLVAAAAACVAAWLAYGWTPTAIPSRRTKDDPDFIEPIKVGLTVAAGFGGAVALVVAFRKQRILERDEAGERDRAAAQRAEAAAEREVQKAFRDRYGAAAAQLGHEDPTVRLAGVYAVANLADEWVAQRQQCVHVLCAHLRLPWQYQVDAEHPLAAKTVEQVRKRRPAETIRYAYPNDAGEVEVRRTILGVIADHLRDPQQDPTPGAELTPGPWSDLRLDFTGATLPELNWMLTFIPPNVRFEGASFAGPAWFGGASFAGPAWFGGASFAGDAAFGRASFAGTAWFGGRRSPGPPRSGGGVVRRARRVRGGVVRRLRLVRGCDVHRRRHLREGDVRRDHRRRCEGKPRGGDVHSAA